MTAIFYYCYYTCTLQIIIAVFHWYICFWFRVIRFHSFFGGGLGNLLSYYSDDEGPADCGSGVKIAEEADGVDVEILLVAFMQDFHI